MNSKQAARKIPDFIFPIHNELKYKVIAKYKVVVLIFVFSLNDPTIREHSTCSRYHIDCINW